MLKLSNNKNLYKIISNTIWFIKICS